MQLKIGKEGRENCVRQGEDAGELVSAKDDNEAAHHFILSAQPYQFSAVSTISEREIDKYETH